MCVADRFYAIIVWLQDDNVYTPNERLDVGNFRNSIVASAILFPEIAKTR